MPENLKESEFICSVILCIMSFSVSRSTPNGRMTMSQRSTL